MKSLHAPSTRFRRPSSRRLAALGLAAVVAGGLAGCQVDNTPTRYDDNVRANFLATCTGNLPNVSTTTVIASESQCVCAYDVFVANVPYNSEDRSRVSGYPDGAPYFHDLDNQLAGDQGPFDELPEPVRQKVQACRTAGAVGPTAGSTAPGTTAAPGTTVASTTSTTAAP